MANRFNIRVYGLLVVDGRILVSDERIRDFAFTKFPGGGLEFGEGVEDCLIREWQEEAQVTITIDSHFYTTGFYQESAFNPNDQVISIYYRVSTGELDRLEIQNSDPAQQLRWIALKDLTLADVTFPIDKHVVGLLKQLESQPVS